MDNSPSVQITRLDGTTSTFYITAGEKLTLDRVSKRIFEMTGVVARFSEVPLVERCFSAEQEAAIAAAMAAREELLPPARHVDLIDAIRANDDEGLRKHWGTMNVPFPIDYMEEKALDHTVWWTALNVAAALQRFDMMKFLVSRGAAVDGVESPTGVTTESPVFTAAALGLRASLVALEELGASMTRRLDDDLAVPDTYATLFEAALSSGCIETVRHCLARGAPFDVRALWHQMYHNHWSNVCCLRVKAHLLYPMFELFLSEIAKLDDPEAASRGRNMLLATVCSTHLDLDVCDSGGHMACCIPLLQSAGADLSGRLPNSFKVAHGGRTPLEVAVMCCELPNMKAPRLEVVASLLRCGVAVPDESRLLILDRQYIERFTQPAYGGHPARPPSPSAAIAFLRQVCHAGSYRSYIGGLRARVAATRQLYASGRALPAVFGGPDPSHLAFLRAQGVDAAVVARLEATLRVSGVVQRLFSQPGDVFQAIVRFWIS
jgi:hypothetical protein